MEYIIHFLRGVVAIVITFGLAVFVHEGGHMIFALMRGVGVESFAIGMGTKIKIGHITLQWYWRGIEFSLRWLPIGGFVKLKGPERPAPPAEAETEPAAATTGEQTEAEKEKSLAESSYDDLYALADKDTLTKLLVFGGGVFMNFVTAIFAVALLLWMGEEMPLVKFQVEKVQPGSAIAAAGLHAGDLVTAVNGKPIAYFQDFTEAVKDQFEKDAAANPKTDPKQLSINFDLTVKRDSTTDQLPFKQITPQKFSDLFDTTTMVLHIPPLIGDVYPSTPAWQAGVKPGDRVVSVNGIAVQSFGDMAEIIRAHADRTCSMTLDRKGTIVNVRVTPIQNVIESKQGVIGVTAASEATRLVRIANPLEALARAPQAAISRLMELGRQQKRFLQRASLKQVGQNLGGPITIFAITAHSASRGLRDAINWFITLNLLLFLLNILPIPVLDGGFILLALIEAVIRRPVPPRILAPIYTAFMIFFIGLIVVISFFDISRLL